MKQIQAIYNKGKAALLILQSVTQHILFKRQSRSIKKNTLLLLKLDSIGDYILFRDLIAVLKTTDKYKDYKISLCGNSWWKELSEQFDGAYVDEFIWIDYAKMKDFNYRFNLFRTIHRKGYEVLLHPTYSRDMISDSVVIHSGAKYKIGYDGNCVNITPTQKDKNNLSYTTLIKPSSTCLFEFYRNRYFFEQVLQQQIQLPKPQLNYSVTVSNKIIICPGAKEFFRRWSPINFAELCAKLQYNFPDCEFIICGSQADHVFAKEMMTHSAIPFLDYTGKLSLLELLQLVSQARLVIANDSGPFHMAVALNKKVVCIANGSHYGRFTPYPQEMRTSSIVVFPNELLELNSEEERLKQFCTTPRSTLDINTISAATVYLAMKQKLFI